MVYLIYKKDIGDVINIVDSIPEVLDNHLAFIETNSFKLDDIKKYNMYVDNGAIISEQKSVIEIKAIQLEKDNIQQGLELSEREIQEIIQGQQISDLEIQLLELQMGGM